jgi:triosephosphate isomerase
MNPLIVANWKMNKTLAEAVSYVQAIGESLEQLKKVDVVLCPSFISLPVLDGLLRDSGIALGAQNVAATKSGAHTGEISAEMLAPHAQYVIIGHSERRREASETLEMVNEKIKRTVEAGLQPIVCISNEEELQALTKIDATAIQWIVAFEPLEAIGSGKPSDPEEVTTMVKKIKKILKGSRVLYGGSVDLENIQVYLKVSDGSLVGGASLDPRNFLDLCTIASGV